VLQVVAAAVLDALETCDRVCFSLADRRLSSGETEKLSVEQSDEDRGPKSVRRALLLAQRSLLAGYESSGDVLRTVADNAKREGALTVQGEALEHAASALLDDNPSAAASMLAEAAAAYNKAGFPIFEAGAHLRRAEALRKASEPSLEAVNAAIDLRAAMVDAPRTRALLLAAGARACWRLGASRRARLLLWSAAETIAEETAVSLTDGDSARCDAEDSTPHDDGALVWLAEAAGLADSPDVNALSYWGDAYLEILRRLLSLAQREQRWEMAWTAAARLLRAGAESRLPRTTQEAVAGALAGAASRLGNGLPADVKEPAGTPNAELLGARPLSPALAPMRMPDGSAGATRQRKSSFIYSPFERTQPTDSSTAPVMWVVRERAVASVRLFNPFDFSIIIGWVELNVDGVAVETHKGAEAMRLDARETAEVEVMCTPMAAGQIVIAGVKVCCFGGAWNVVAAERISIEVAPELPLLEGRLSSDTSVTLFRGECCDLEVELRNSSTDVEITQALVTLTNGSGVTNLSGRFTEAEIAGLKFGFSGGLLADSLPLSPLSSVRIPVTLKASDEASNTRSNRAQPVMSVAYGGAGSGIYRRTLQIPIAVQVRDGLAVLSVGISFVDGDDGKWCILSLELVNSSNDCAFEAWVSLHGEPLGKRTLIARGGGSRDLRAALPVPLASVEYTADGLSRAVRLHWSVPDQARRGEVDLRASLERAMTPELAAQLRPPAVALRLRLCSGGAGADGDGDALPSAPLRVPINTFLAFELVAAAADAHGGDVSLEVALSCSGRSSAAPEGGAPAGEASVVWAGRVERVALEVPSGGRASHAFGLVFTSPGPHALVAYARAEHPAHNSLSCTPLLLRAV